MNSRVGRYRMVVVAVLFGLTIFFLLGIAYSSRRNRVTLHQAQHEIERDQRMRNLVSLIRQHNIAAETAERGFLITGETLYLDPYEQALTYRAENMRLIKELAPDFPRIAALFPELEILLEDRDQELEAAIAQRRANNLDETVQTVREGMRRNLSAQIRRVLDHMEEIVDDNLVLAESEYRRQVDRAALFLNLAAYSSLVLGVLGLVFLIGHLRDQIRTIQLERDKDEAERMAHEKSRFLASMNHEIRTPLNALLGFSELLDNEVTSDRGRRYLAAIRTSGGTLADLINDILDLSRIESGILELAPCPVNVREFARGIQVVFEEQASGRGLLFEFSVDEDCPERLVFDPIRVRQVLANLLGNALKFTTEGSIRGCIRADKVEAESCELLFSVRDTGRGIAPEKMAMIFQPFRQAESSDEMLGGTGLGLSICHELATLMGGALEVMSEVGAGSEFRLLLPHVERVKTPGSPTTEDTATASFDDLPPSRILVVDDNPFNIELIAGFFEDTHHHIEYAENGLAALDRMKETPPDIVLMDIRMPVMGGDEARALMQEDDRLADVPVIAVTASTLSSQDKQIRECFDGYLRKPFTRASLFRGMSAVLARRAGAPDGVARDTSENQRNPRPTATTVPPADPAPAGQKRTREGLVEALETLRDERWPHLLRAMLLSDVDSVADELGHLAVRYDEPALADYARELHAAVEQIHPPRIEKLLKGFHELIEKIS
ncbi:MAG: response regulator [Verrucomicrobiaceae bacterium]|nr:response regulator [Verrucomicrobiaceae bacterium]